MDLPKFRGSSNPLPEMRAEVPREDPFPDQPKARVTRAFEWEMSELRSQMSTTAAAARLDVDPDTVNDAEKRILDAKYRRVDLKGVRMIGIDELYVFGNERSNRKYITVARDMETSAVLNVYAADRKRRRVMPP